MSIKYIVIARHHNRMVVDADVFPLFLDDHYGSSQAVAAEVKPTATTASWGRYREEYKSQLEHTGRVHMLMCLHVNIFISYVYKLICLYVHCLYVYRFVRLYV